VNPYTFILFAIGVLLILIGFHGTQHKIADAFRGVQVGQTHATLHSGGAEANVGQTVGAGNV
jgi:hypothetical protein